MEQRSVWYRCRNCGGQFSSPFYRAECFCCGGDDGYDWTLAEAMFFAVILLALATAMTWLQM